MKSHQFKLFVLLAMMILPSAGILAQSSGKSNFELKRRNPDGWFSLLIPQTTGKVARFADVDGGAYNAKELKIKYDYWTFENAPNFLLNAGIGNQSPLLACSKVDYQTHTLRTKIDKRRAIIQECLQTKTGKDFQHIYYVTFPALKVFDGKNYREGTFNLTVLYKNKRYSAVAQQIIRSIDF